MPRYTILTQGPDNHSTYAECWGSTATSSGRLIASCSDFASVVEAIHDLGHTNYTVRDRRRHKTYNGPALKDMRAEIQEHK